MSYLYLDLHSHSGYSGGVGQMSVKQIVEGMKIKGIDIFGSGDCLHEIWIDMLQQDLVDDHDGVFYSKYSEDKGFILQTEVIFTLPYLNTSRRKLFHMIMLFPDFNSIFKVRELLVKMGVSLNIGRPFIKFKDKYDVSCFIEKVKEIDSDIEFIPAHVMTPQGIFGAKNPIYHLDDVFGDSKKYIYIVETGLSADPDMLSNITELNNINLISNSDCHSPYLYRLGREFTRINIEDISYKKLIQTIRDKKKTFTYEFPPTEGKFFLTGHRKGKVGHKDSPCVFSPKYSPVDNMCPICNKTLTIGVYQQLQNIIDHQSKHDIKIPRKNFKNLIPLVDVVRESMGVRSYTKKVIKTTKDLIDKYGSEVRFWEEFNPDIHSEDNIDDKIVMSINEVMNGNFSFFPGYDGEYGKLQIGNFIDYKEIRIK